MPEWRWTSDRRLSGAGTRSWDGCGRRRGFTTGDGQKRVDTTNRTDVSLVKGDGVVGRQRRRSSSSMQGTVSAPGSRCAALDRRAGTVRRANNSTPNSRALCKHQGKAHEALARGLMVVAHGLHGTRAGRKPSGRGKTPLPKDESTAWPAWRRWPPFRGQLGCVIRPALGVGIAHGPKLSDICPICVLLGLPRMQTSSMDSFSPESVRLASG